MIQIGRVGGDVTFDRGPASASWQGDRLTLSGHLQASTTANQKALRQQLLGHADNPDEPVIPIVWPYDTDVTGFYEVLGVGVELFQKPDTVVKFDLDLQRVPGYQAPLFELWSRGTLRVNAHSITTSNATPWIGVPSSVTNWDVPISSASGGRARVLDGDGVTIYYVDGGVGAAQTTFFDAVSTFYLPPANFYDGAATLTRDGSVVVGEQTINDPTDWIVGNDLVQVEWTSSGVFNVSVFDGTNWRAKGYKIGDQSGSLSTADPSSVTVLRNSPECVSIRLVGVRLSIDSGTSTGTDTLNQFAVNLDVTVRRGARYAEFVATSTRARGWLVARSSAEDGTVTTGALVATGDDANGDQYVIACPLDFVELGDGVAVGDSLVGADGNQTVFPFAIGLDTGTDGVLPSPDPATIDIFSAAGIVRQYMAATAIRQNLAVR